MDYNVFIIETLLWTNKERCTWSHSAWTRFFTAALTTAVSAAAAVHDAHLNGLDALRTLEVGLGLWVLSLAGRALDAVTLLLLLHVGAFTVPLAYKTYKAKIDRLVGDVYGKAHQQYERLDRRVRATVVLVPLLVLFFMLPLIDRFVAFFICLAYGRVWAKPDEYLAVQRKALEPLGKALTSALTPATTHAAAAMAKYDITPTPTKKKAN
ncbi:hypothetical protein TSOC_008109 [Tetrabaena socialis]|uniref:Reticulon-like protein n=1 Tax=Tetrabaena socialis TaxID=47790 RepID=A0A2J7ZZB0_9CHLO|nr:hypothetical protein TSOC_008109 [Tetrabaena socialis]|eukprot:PNH05602.1 hypothetical protein TSOC_008109 [Tetrabaena socialis]